MDNNRSKIITFYSYKGGVGRSMALANTAWILAERGQKVLVVDWDIEAPGIYKFFIDNERGKSEDFFKGQKGLVDLVTEHVEQKNPPALAHELKKVREAVAQETESFSEYERLLTSREKEVYHQQSVNNDIPSGAHFPIIKEFDSGGAISLLTAGRQDEDYIKKVNALSWDEFYKNHNGYNFIEQLKLRFKRGDYDYILIDSRTGVTDAGGICTLQLPDAVVMLFALNEQNLEGTLKIVSSINKNYNDRPIHKPAIILQPARVEFTSEQELLEEWNRKAVVMLDSYVLPGETSIERKEQFMQEIAIPYVGYYNFGETIAARKQPNSLLTNSYRKLAERILLSSGNSITEHRLDSAENKKAGILSKMRAAGDRLSMLSLFKVSVLLTGAVTMLAYSINAGWNKVLLWTMLTVVAYLVVDILIHFFDSRQKMEVIAFKNSALSIKDNYYSILAKILRFPAGIIMGIALFAISLNFIFKAFEELTQRNNELINEVYSQRRKVSDLEVEGEHYTDSIKNMQNRLNVFMLTIQDTLKITQKGITVQTLLDSVAFKYAQLNATILENDKAIYYLKYKKEALESSNKATEDLLKFSNNQRDSLIRYSNSLDNKLKIAEYAQSALKQKHERELEIVRDKEKYQNELNSKTLQENIQLLGDNKKLRIENDKLKAQLQAYMSINDSLKK